MAENSLLSQIQRDKKMLEGLSKAEQTRLSYEVRLSVTMSPGYRFEKKK